MCAQITDRTIGDGEFQNLLISNPMEAISRELGVDIPEDFDIVVHESDAWTLHLALPTIELGEEESEEIAAGRCC